MEFIELVNQRRSIFKFDDKPVYLSEIMPLLSLANLAPNHHLTQPWQFLWIGEQTKETLSDHYALARATKKLGKDGKDDPMFAETVTRAKEKFLRTPAIIMVACRLDLDPIIAEEDYAATCCAIQNFLLAVTNAGLGAQWSTHPMIRDDKIMSCLELNEYQRLVAMIYLGHPAVIPPAPPRIPVEAFVKILS